MNTAILLLVVASLGDLIVASNVVDLCNPSPCGENVPCGSFNGAALCECVPGSFSRAGKNGCAPDCVNHPDCPGNQRCVNSKCVDHTNEEECGRSNIEGVVPLVAGGMTSTIVGKFPWHIGVFKRHEGGFIIWCGGTLIKPNVVISAAHCFWDDTYNRLNSVSDYKLAGAKLLRSWNDHNPVVQRRDVLHIHIPPLFSGFTTETDIAVVRLTSPFIINAAVNVACVDWDGYLEEWHLQAGKNGVVAGWGLTEDEAQSETLKSVELPYVSPPDCLAALARDLKPLLTFDKFCAGLVNGTQGICPGDMGGGLLFSLNNTDKYYVRGIASAAFSQHNNNKRCHTKNVTGFTKVSLFLTWIKGFM